MQSAVVDRGRMVPNERIKSGGGGVTFVTGSWLYSSERTFHQCSALIPIIFIVRQESGSASLHACIRECIHQTHALAASVVQVRHRSRNIHFSPLIVISKGRAISPTSCGNLTPICAMTHSFHPIFECPINPSAVIFHVGTIPCTKALTCGSRHPGLIFYFYVVQKAFSCGRQQRLHNAGECNVGSMTSTNQNLVIFSPELPTMRRAMDG